MALDNDQTLNKTDTVGDAKTRAAEEMLENSKTGLGDASDAKSQAAETGLANATILAQYFPPITLADVAMASLEDLSIKYDSPPDKVASLGDQKEGLVQVSSEAAIRSAVRAAQSGTAFQGWNGLVLRVPFRGALLTARIDADGERPTREQVARLREYLQMVENDSEGGEAAVDEPRE